MDLFVTLILGAILLLVFSPVLAALAFIAGRMFQPKSDDTIELPSGWMCDPEKSQLQIDAESQEPMVRD